MSHAVQINYPSEFFFSAGLCVWQQSSSKLMEEGNTPNGTKRSLYHSAGSDYSSLALFVVHDFTEPGIGDTG